MNPAPAVTVLLPVHNAEAFIEGSVRSILQQTFTDFELLVIDDGSTDRTPEILRGFTDPRLRLEPNGRNLGLIATLNRGLDLARGRYIARMDADDLALPARLEKQYACMEARPDVGVLGTWVRTLGLDEDYDITFGRGHDYIRFRLFFSNYLHHPSVMLRKSVLDTHGIRYGDYLHIEDYEMWLRIAEYARIDILPEILLRYRIHGNNISMVNKDFQENHSARMRRRQVESLGISVTDAEWVLYEAFLERTPVDTVAGYRMLVSVLERIVRANREKRLVEPGLLEAFFGKRLYEATQAGTRLGWGMYRAFRRSLFFRMEKRSVPTGIRLFVKCLISYSR